MEIVLAMAVLVAPLPSLLLGISLWKMGTEALFMTAGSLPFEWIERAGSYVAPFALSSLMVTHTEGKEGNHVYTAMVLYEARRHDTGAPRCHGTPHQRRGRQRWAEGRTVEDLGAHLQHRDTGAGAAAETSDQTKAELAELRQLQKERSPSANTAIQYYNAVPATQRWHDLAFMLARAEKQSPNRQARLAGILHTALHDAVIVTWAAKYHSTASHPARWRRT